MSKAITVVEIVGKVKNYIECLTLEEAKHQVKKLINLGSKAYIQ